MYNMSMNDRQISQLEIVKTKVRQLLGGDTSGHADDHVERVALLAERFTNECNESVNLQEVLLTAWLHDVDDYKLVGKTQAEKLTNAVNIMAQAEIADDLSQVVLENIAAIGYSKRLNGKQPQRLAGQLERAGQHNYVTLSTTGVQADWQASITPLADGSSQLELRAFDGKSATVQVLMPGAFNAANAALAMVMVVSGCSPSPRQLDGAVLRRLAAHPIHVDVPGRMEVISEGGTKEPRIIVDFAHNPGALRSLLEALRPSTPGRLLLVFGATGQRDTEKRPILGEICAKFADYFYLTDDDPHDEDPQAIRQAVRAGIPQGQDNFEEIDGRETAIRRAIAAAQPGDTVVIAGRGHETVQETASAAINLDDRAVAREALALR